MLIDFMELSPRTYRSLKRVGLDTAEEIKRYGIDNLMNVTGIGYKALKEIKTSLRENSYID